MRSRVESVLDGGLIVVTGAGTGLGRALSIELCNRGRRVAGLARSKADIDETARLCQQDHFIPCVADVAEPLAIRTLFRELSATRAPVTILINNAAIYHRCDFLSSDPRETMESLDINLGGIVNCTLAALESMSESGIGRIINVASFADLWPLAGSLPYSVSKGAARVFTRALVAEIGHRLPDIVVNDWVPGMLATRMGVSDGLEPAVAARWGATLALMHDRTLNGATFDRNLQILPQRSLKRRLLDLALFRPPPKPVAL